VRALSPWSASAIGIGALIVGWFVYDGLCRSPLGRNDVALGAVVFAYIVAASYLFTLVFNGRAAFLHTGAMIATWMSASVFLVIIPNQKKVVADLIAGRTPDPKLGKEAKQRSNHNNYLTLPVLFLMLSNHYPLAWSSRWNWAIVGLVVVAGAVVRHFYNSRHAGRGSPWWVWVVAAVSIALAIWLSAIGKPEMADSAPPRATLSPALEAAVGTIQSRCAMCHAAEPVWAGIAAAPKGVRFDTAEDVARHADAIRVQSVMTRAMPPNNITGMTTEERRVVAAWLAERDAARAR
jgi:uncharacterized membrane protein